VTTLAVAGGVAGFFIVLVHLWSQPRIEAYQARVLGEAVQEVLGGPETTSPFFLHEGAFTPSPPSSADTASMDRVYVGWDEAGTPVGIAAAAGEPGFQDIIGLIFGFDPGSGDVLGMKVLESKETPGLGDKIIKDSAFVREFRGVQTPLEGVKPARATGAGNEIDMITGATISSQAVVDIINNRVAALEGALRTLWEQGVPAPEATASGRPASGPASTGASFPRVLAGGGS
jgi:electron transport complex protein RnfG